MNALKSQLKDPRITFVVMQFQPDAKTNCRDIGCSLGTLESDVMFKMFPVQRRVVWNHLSLIGGAGGARDEKIWGQRK